MHTLARLMDKATVKLVATKEEWCTVDLSESETWSFHDEAATGRPVAYKNSYRETWSIQQIRKLGKSKKLKEKNGHIICTCLQPQCLTLKAVFSIVRKIYEREPDGSMEDLNVNAAVWDIYLNATPQAAVHLGQNHEVNLRFAKNHLWSAAEQLFNETGKLIRDQTEITGVTTIDFKELTWRSTSLLCSRAYQITNAKTYIFSNSVLCVWEKWEMIRLQLGRTKLIVFGEQSLPRTESHRRYANGVRVVNISRIHDVGPLQKFESLMRVLKWCELEQFKDRIIFMSMYNDIAWREKGNTEGVWTQIKDNCELRSQIPSRSLVFPGAWIRKEMVRNLFW